MREPRVVETCVAYPNHCACGSQQAPLIDTLITNHQGRLYVCARCLNTWAGLLGFKSPDELQAAEDDRLAQAAIRETLEERLVEAEANKVVSINDLAEELRRRTQPAAV